MHNAHIICDRSQALKVIKNKPKMHVIEVLINWKQIYVCLPI